MSKFKIGNKVVVTVTRRRSSGKTGRVKHLGALIWVKLDSGQCFPFCEHEIELVTMDASQIKFSKSRTRKLDKRVARYQAAVNRFHGGQYLRVEFVNELIKEMIDFQDRFHPLQYSIGKRNKNHIVELLLKGGIKNVTL